MAESGVMDSTRSEEGGDFEVWAEETVDIETPFSSTTQDDIEYLKLEIAELKQILISLAEKYKLSEDRRKVAERRNSFLKADNMRLQQMSDSSLSQKIEAEIENRRTLDKLREFIDFKQEFEKQADLLKKIISHLPKMKNVSTSTKLESAEKSEQCCGDVRAFFVNSDQVLCDSDDLGVCTSTDVDCSGDNHMTCDTEPKEYQYFLENDDEALLRILTEEDGDGVGENRAHALSQMAMSICEKLNEDKSPQDETLHIENQVRAWNPKMKKEVPNSSINLSNNTEMKTTKSKVKLSKLKQEVLALKNMNEWKSSDLDYKNRQLVVKNRELSQAKKEITQLKMRVSRLVTEQQKRPTTSFPNPTQIKGDVKNRQEKGIRDGAGQHTKVHHREPSKMAVSTSKMSSTEGEVATGAKRKQTITSPDQQRLQTLKLPLSTESVWREIAPGDQVRIKIKKQALE